MGDQIEAENVKIRRRRGKTIPLYEPPHPGDLWNDLDDKDAVDPFDPEATKPEADESTPEACDEYLTAEVLLPHGGDFLKAIVGGRKRDHDGAPIGTRNANPLLDSRE